MTMKNKKTFLKLVLFILTTCFVQSYAVEEGTLTVTTEPEGVEAWLGDKYLGDSPINNRKLKAGRYTLKLIDPVQQVSTTEEVLIQAGQHTIVEKTLKAKFGTLIVDSEPQGAEVHVSTFLGKTPLENNFMNPGKYRIEIKHPKNKYTPVIDSIVIPAGKKVEITSELVKTSPFDRKAMIRGILGVGAIAGFVWAVIEQGNHKMNDAYSKSKTIDEDAKEEFEKNSHTAAIKRTLGIIGGSLCVIGFEIVAFF